MSLSSDNFTAIIHLREQARKWKNIAFLAFILTFLLLAKFIFSSSDDGEVSVDSVGSYIANVTIEGIILDDDYRSEVLKKIAQSSNIKAVIVNINSPGGGIVGSEVLYENLREIAAAKPIVVTMGSLAASGGYMAAIASDYIIARNGTLTGSIGVLMNTSEFTDMAEKLGVRFLTYKSSPLKGSPSPFEKSNPMIDRVINASIKDSYEFFSGMVKERRGDKLSKNLNEVLDGRVFTGRQALQVGLIDEIGGKVEAIKYLKDQKNINVDKLEVKDVEIKKAEKKLISNFFGVDEMIKLFKGVSQSQGLMAILDVNQIQ